MEVKEKVTVRFSAIDRAMVKYDPENMRLSSEWGGQYNGNRTPSGRGGGGAENNGTPYYVMKYV